MVIWLFCLCYETIIDDFLIYFDVPMISTNPFNAKLCWVYYFGEDAFCYCDEDFVLLNECWDGSVGKMDLLSKMFGITVAFMNEDVIGNCCWSGLFSVDTCSIYEPPLLYTLGDLLWIDAECFLGN